MEQHQQLPKKITVYSVVEEIKVFSEMQIKVVVFLETQCKPTQFFQTIIQHQIIFLAIMHQIMEEVYSITQ